MSGGQAGLLTPAGLPDPQGVERDVQHPGDTHETAAVGTCSPPEGFDPELLALRATMGAAGRFHYIPFGGGGARSCLGQGAGADGASSCSLELVRRRWEPATPAFPAMQTVPIVHPVDGLRLFPPSCVSGGAGWATPLTCCAVEPGFSQRLRDLVTAHLPFSSAGSGASSFIKGS